ncbi:Exosome complex component RRP41 [Cryptotermes secundus]|uniref:Putative exosome complex component RRP41 n=1 Tax=Cryptotermes secundus TaxID=105785 RepID=A0A2J7QAU9_9NEOP|nr:exosome complex component RRP41 [Cryptotermes secundus]PNF25704.1 Exosome complex component RRP41 [Cryptotermes secundus]
MARMDLISFKGLRLDGRRANELRQIRCKMGVFSQPDGSAYLEQGNTKVLAAVYGPHEIRGSRSKALHDKALVNCQYSMATFSTGERKRRPRGDRKSQEMSMHLRQAFQAAIRVEVYPRSQIDIFVEVLQADGGNYCACVNAATLALVDAGIPMTEYVVACTASLANGDVPLVDVSNLEENSGGPNLTVAALPLSGQVALMEMSQRFHLDHLPKVVECALQGCRDIHQILDQAVRRHTEMSGSALGWGNRAQVDL